MTLVLAVCKPDAVVLAADSKVGDGRGGSSTDDKIWQLRGGYGIVTWGCGPVGVPATVSAYVPNAVDVRSAAEGLMAHLSVLPRAGEWGFFLGGVDSSGARMAQGLLPSGKINFLGSFGYWGAGAIGVATLPAWRGDILSRPVSEIAANALLLLEQAAVVDSASIGPPHRALVIHGGASRWLP
jgi:hypothetical protein